MHDNGLLHDVVDSCDWSCRLADCDYEQPVDDDDDAYDSRLGDGDRAEDDEGDSMPRMDCPAELWDPPAPDSDHPCSFTPDVYANPAPIFYGKFQPGKRNVYLGWELEVEFSPWQDVACVDGRTRGAYATAVNVLANNVPRDILWLKSDASLSHGFEIVTHPMTYEWAERNFPWHAIEALKKYCKASSPPGAGLHVHVNRTAFSDSTHEYRWLRQIYRMQEPITALARRDSSQWAAWSDELRQQVKAITKDGYKGFDRYTAVNVRNRATYEVRVFRSTTNPTKIRAALGLIDATVEYTRKLTVKAANEGGWEWAGFSAWVRERADRYASLVSEIERLGLCAS